PETFAAFFGLVLASVWIVRNHVDHWTASRVVACAFGGSAAIAISLLPVGSADSGLVYLFFSASVAICAMILPGISGAFVLVLLGVYHTVTGLSKDAAKGDITPESLVQLLVFAAGCGFGLLAFSKLLRWLLEHHRGTTLAGLMGLMLGSVAKLWPLQMPTAETAELDFKQQVMRYVSPADWPGSVLPLVILAMGAGLAVLAIERLAGRNTERDRSRT
ncbi:MAG: DUF368 domain-containing protein, partial [Pirellulales bacterium]|nr:DUF368 domain-containing protein [Pirellulales bacterium]